MIISCPNCARKYSVEDGKLIPNKKLRCAACGTIWEYVPEEENGINNIENLDFASENNVNSANINTQENLTENNLDDNKKDVAISHDQEIQKEQPKVADQEPKKTENNKKVNKKKSSFVGIVFVLLMVVIVCRLGLYFKDYSLYYCRNIYSNNILGKIIEVVASDTVLPKIENISTEIKDDELFINGDVVNLSNYRTEYKFLKIRLTPDLIGFKNMLMSDPLACLLFTEDNYVKLPKTVLNPNERVKFSTKIELKGIKSLLVRIKLCNL